MIAVPPTLSTSHGHSKSAQKRAIRDAQARLASAEAEKWTPFRAAEKAYMVRGPGIRPDLGYALDLALLDAGRVYEYKTGGWAGSSDALPFREIPFASQTGRKRAYVLPDIPGVFIITLSLRIVS
jgi:alkylated DNA repair protein alkB family protein 1